MIHLSVDASFQSWISVCEEQSEDSGIHVGFDPERISLLPSLFSEIRFFCFLKFFSFGCIASKNKMKRSTEEA